MIDIKKAEEEFRKYTSKYDMSASHLYRKVTHTSRVENICEKIAISLQMNEEDINLAKLIGLLHDIGRFEQYTTYKTFADHLSIDHGDFGVEILEKDNYIRKYIETDRYDEIIKKAIYNHNKFTIQENLSEREKVFCEIIRDADKLDIMYQATIESWKNDIKEIEEQVITKKVVEQFLKESTINKEIASQYIDRLVVVMAFIYDLNFKESYKVIKDNEYINKMIDRFDFKKDKTRKQIETIQKIANDYINNQIK